MKQQRRQPPSCIDQSVHLSKLSVNCPVFVCVCCLHVLAGVPGQQVQLSFWLAKEEIKTFGSPSLCMVHSKKRYLGIYLTNCSECRDGQVQ